MNSLLDRLMQPLVLAARLRKRNRKKALKFHDSDVMILRYPKSGVTWLRVMISHVYQQRFGIPESEVIGTDSFHRLAPATPKIFIAMDNVDDDLVNAMMAALGRKKVILLLRDPRDVAVSMFFHFSKRSTPLERAAFKVPDGIAEGGIFEFVKSPSYGMPRVISFMNRWWDKMETSPDTLVLRYEDMKSDPERALTAVMKLIAEDVSASEISRAVEFAAFENMKGRERDNLFRGQILRPANKDDEDSYKVRRGEAGKFATYFTAEQITEINLLLRSTIDPRIGYS